MRRKSLLLILLALLVPIVLSGCGAGTPAGVGLAPSSLRQGESSEGESSESQGSPEAVADRVQEAETDTEEAEEDSESASEMAAEHVHGDALGREELHATREAAAERREAAREAAEEARSGYEGAEPAAEEG
jgi:hypothetical protein